MRPCGGRLLREFAREQKNIAAPVTGLTGLVIVYAVLSWVQTASVMADVVERLCAPPLTPIRRLVPLVGGVDLSPLALLVLLQVAAIVLGHLQGLILLSV